MATTIAKHTAPPWRVLYSLANGETDATGIKDRAGNTLIAGPRQPVAVARLLPNRSEEQHANALLIAAAPELFAACEKVLTWILEGQPATTPDVIGDLETAIRKATNGKDTP